MKKNCGLPNKMEDGKITYCNRRKIMVRYENLNGSSNSMTDNAMDAETAESEKPAFRQSKSQNSSELNVR